MFTVKELLDHEHKRYNDTAEYQEIVLNSLESKWAGKPSLTTTVDVAPAS